MYKKPQMKWSIGFVIFLILLTVFVWQISGRLALSLLVGISIGFVMERSRFCFASAFRDPFLVGMTNLTQAMILLLMLSIVGFAILIHVFELLGWSYELNIFPLGLNTVVGGLLFGVGMILAGGCASGILMRMGEGFVMQFLAFLGLIVGVVLGEDSMPFWQSTFGVWTERVFLPDLFGWTMTLIIELLFLALLWWLFRRYQQKRLER